MIYAIIISTIAALGNALFVYGQKGTQETHNPFIFLFGTVAISTVLFLISTFFFNNEKSITYLIVNWKYVVISGIGLFITFLGFYLLYTGYGASAYILYAVISLIITSIGVGVLFYKEAFNIYHFLALVFSIVTISFYCYGQHISDQKKQITHIPIKENIVTKT